MKFQIGAMSVGDILDRGLKLLLERLPTFYAINLIVLSPLILYQLFMPLLLQKAFSGGAFLGLFLAGSILVIFLMFVLQPICSAAILQVIAQEFVGRPVGIAEGLKFALGRFGHLLLASVALVLIALLGFCMCVVPCILFLVWFCFVPQVVVVEGVSAFDSFERSKKLTEGFRWRVLGVLAILMVIHVMVAGMSNTLERILPSMDMVPADSREIQTPRNPFEDPTFKNISFNYRNYLINNVVGLVVQILVQSFQAICLTLLYFDLRIRKEGFDLELAARQQLPGTS